MTGAKRAPLSRRQILRQILGTSFACPLPLACPGLAQGPAPLRQLAMLPGEFVLSPEDDQFLNDLEKASFLFSGSRADSENGDGKGPLQCSRSRPGRSTCQHCSDRIRPDGALHRGAARIHFHEPMRWTRAFTTLRFLWKKLPNHRGFFYHFANLETGERMFDSEVSSVDTAILLCGVLTCREHFRHPGTRNACGSDLQPRGLDLAVGGHVPADPRLDAGSRISALAVGLLQRTDDDVSAGHGSAAHPLRQETWNAWKRLTFEYDGMRYIGSFAPLFVHQYPQAWFDFRGKRDQYVDYFKNSVTATEVHRRFCLELRQSSSPTTATICGGSRLPIPSNGYVVWGGPPATGPIDGTVVPSAAGGSLPFLPAGHTACLEDHPERYPSRLDQVRIRERVQSPQELV